MYSSVLFVHPKNDYTGSTRVLATILSTEYANSTIPVITYRNNNKGFLSELPNVKIISYLRLMIRGKHVPVITDLLIRLQVFVLVLFCGCKYRYLYINTVVPYSAALAGRLIRRKIIYHVHEKFLQKGLTYRIIEKVFETTPSHRIFVSLYTKSCYKESAKCTWEIKYNKLSPDFLNQVIIRPIDERKRNTVLMIASLSKIKGIFNFLELASSLPDLKFRLMLSANMEAIKSYITVPIPENVELIPAQSNIHPYLREADLILNMSIPFFCVETFGMTILEAMPYGVPSIVPNVGGPTELIENDCNGYLADVTNIEGMLKFVRLALERESYNRLVNNTLIRFDEKFK